MIWVVTGKSESGDEYVAAYKKHPTAAQLSDLVHSWDGDDEREGPGHDGSYIYISIIECNLIS
jgi:hypothetical protein